MQLKYPQAQPAWPHSSLGGLEEIFDALHELLFCLSRAAPVRDVGHGRVSIVGHWKVSMVGHCWRVSTV